MGTTKRVPVKPAPKTKKAKAPEALLTPEATRPAWVSLDMLAAELESRLAACTEAVQTCPPTAPFAQAYMQDCRRLERLSQALGKAIGAVYARALSHHAGGGAFEVGKIAVSFPVTGGGRSPSWKGEATKQAGAREGLEHGMKAALDTTARAKVIEASAQHTFDEKRYHEQVLDATPRGASHTGVAFTEGA